MPANFEDLLDRCLADRAIGRPLDACLQRAEPPDRGELEGLLVLVDGLRSASRPGLSASARASHERLLLARAAALRQASQSARAHPNGRPSLLAGFARLLGGWRPGFAPVAAMLLLVASFVLVASAGSIVSHARPDDAAYNVKLSWEQTQLLLATNNAQRARISLEIAQSRLAEIESLATEGQPIPGELLEQLQLSVSQAMLYSGDLGAREAIPILRNVSELLTYERVLLLRFLASLPEPERATVELALGAVQDAREAAVQALEERVEERVSTVLTTVSPPEEPGETAQGQPFTSSSVPAPTGFTLTIPPAPEAQVTAEEGESTGEGPGKGASAHASGSKPEAEGELPGRRLGADNRPDDTGHSRATAVQQAAESQDGVPDLHARGKPDPLPDADSAEPAGAALDQDDLPGHGQGGPVERGSEASQFAQEERGQPATTRGSAGQAGQVGSQGADQSGAAKPAVPQPKQQSVR